LQASAQPEGQFESGATEDAHRQAPGPPLNDPTRTLADSELDSALQLLVERAQYITGATGTALALPQGEEMVCRASAGASAPSVGARLQVRSGLTGESIVRRQLLRCDNAETDPRVNLETCRALGIASIVVLPLLRRNGDVRGLFELFSDHPYAFEERDLIALERMADLTATALDLAEQRQGSLATSPVAAPTQKAAEAPASASPRPATVIPLQTPANPEGLPQPVSPSVSAAGSPAAAPIPAVEPTIEYIPATGSEPVVPPVPAAMLRVQKCASCGFPVSEGRMLCLDCERKESEKGYSGARHLAGSATANPTTAPMKGVGPDAPGPPDGSPDPAAGLVPAEEAEILPAFLANAQPVKESWLSNHVNLLAIMVLILGVLVAIVVFR
jgi:putative methionine-R-sulfoxide reductase with GAF domain